MLLISFDARSISERYGALLDLLICQSPGYWSEILTVLSFAVLNEVGAGTEVLELVLLLLLALLLLPFDGAVCMPAPGAVRCICPGSCCWL